MAIRSSFHPRRRLCRLRSPRGVSSTRLLTRHRSCGPRRRTRARRSRRRRVARLALTRSTPARRIRSATSIAFCACAGPIPFLSSVSPAVRRMRRLFRPIRCRHVVRRRMRCAGAWRRAGGDGTSHLRRRRRLRLRRRRLRRFEVRVRSSRLRATCHPRRQSASGRSRSAPHVSRDYCRGHAGGGG